LRIIGITGTLGAGKGTIVDYLVKHDGFCHFSVRKYLTKLVTEKGLEVNRDTLVQVANELRAANTPSFIAEELYREAAANGGDCVIESIRTVGEVQALKKKGSFWLFAIDADPQVRYGRITERASETDKVTFDTFIENEKREMSNTDPNKQNIAACIELADYTFQNDGTFEDLFKQIEHTLHVIGNN
jgi:dephospho-CoA kinase